MSKNKTYHHVYFTFEEDGHPLIAEWFAGKISEAIRMIKPQLKLAELRDDAVEVEYHGQNTMIKLTLRTNYLGDQQVYTALMGYLLQCINTAKRYVEIKMHFECTDVRKNRMAITTDQGLMINGSSPIELRGVGNVVKALRDDVIDIWVAGEPNAAREEVGRIRQLLRYENGYKNGLDWFIDKIRFYMPKDVAMYIRTKDQPLGMVIHGRAYDYNRWNNELDQTYMEAVKEGLVPDIFNLKASNNWYFDFIAFMEVMLDTVDNYRAAKPGRGGSELVPYEFIQHVLSEVMEKEATVVNS